MDNSQDTLVGRVVARASTAVFGKPLITNTLRGLVAEAIVAEALGPNWTWCSADYSSWDFEHESGARLEVKQSAARQSWAVEGGKPSTCSFDIKSRTGRWEGDVWIAEPGRAAHIYVLAHHPVADMSADHRDPGQWRFYVISSSALPSTHRLSLRLASGLALETTFTGLRDEVQRALSAATA